MNPEPVTPEQRREERTEQESNDLTVLRKLRRHHKARLRSGDPRVRALAEVYLRAVEIEVRKIHRAIEMRVQLKRLGVQS